MKNTLLTICLLFSFTTIHAQHNGDINEVTRLEQEIMKMDSLLFDVAFNKCDFELYKTILIEGLEFYDDRTGLSADIEKDYASFKDKCGRPFAVTRKLIESSVHKLGDFGAVQTGTHVFLNDEKLVQTAKFIHVWERKENGWIVKRAISYEHKDL
ncbi:MAG: nuclear transport factor 2 family protein [Bacteroidota bacterium]